MRKRNFNSDNQQDNHNHHIDTTNMNSFFNSSSILDILSRWKVHLAVIVVLAAILSMFLSSSVIITPLYKSYSIIYPSNVAPYSDETETEQMIQILQSGDIRDNVIKKFRLADHWKLDSNDRHFTSLLNWVYSKWVKINKTPYDAVRIEVWDPDPVMACDMVNAIMEFYNMKVRIMHKEKFLEVVQNYEPIIQQKKGKLDSLTQRAQELGMKFGLMAYESQSREVMRSILGTSGGSRYSEALKYKKNLEEKGGEMLMIQELMRAEAEEFAFFKLDYDRALLNYNREYTHLNLLTKPIPADKKSYPIRWLIVVVSVLAVLFLTILVIGIIEQSRIRKHAPLPDAG
jgi:capsular polysaccharide biosynthesis protein